jgi:hypothetical protein
MNKPVFDANSFVEIDLSSGSISSQGNDRLALISTDILKMLPPSESLHQAATEWGKRHGIRLGDRLEADNNDAGVEALSQHLGGTLAALGMGRVRVEIRRDALMFRTSLNMDDPASGGQWAMLAGFLSGYLTGLTGLPFAVLDLGNQAADRLFWAGNPETARVVESRIDDGSDPLAVVDAAMTGGLA